MAAIVVVGGGLAGLTCAYRLTRSGHDVEVLESESIPGGRVRSERRGAFLIERGAQFIADGYSNLHGLARGLRLAGDIGPAGRVDDAVLRRGRFQAVGSSGLLAFARSPLLSPRAKLGLSRLLIELWRQRASLDPLRPEAALALDGEDMASFLLRTVGAEARDYLIGPAISSTFDSEIEDLSAAFLLLAARLAIGGHRVQYLKGGLGRLTGALANRVSLRTGCRVFAVESETNGVRVRYRAGERERTVVADAAVVAVPGPLVRQLCVKLTPTEAGFFEAVEYARGIIVHLMLESPPAALGSHFGVAFPRSSGLELYGLAVDHHKPGVVPSGAGLVNVALRDTAVDRMWESGDDAVSQLVLEELARTPLGRLSPLQSVVVRWPLMLPRFHPGYLSLLARFLRRSDRSPRLAFAGDYLIGPHSEAAVTSGMRAVSEVVASIGVTGAR